MKNCNCGFPQSYPIPHEHDQTEREKVIIAYYEGILEEKNYQLRTAEKQHYSNYMQLTQAIQKLEENNLI